MQQRLAQLHRLRRRAGITQQRLAQLHRLHRRH